VLAALAVRAGVARGTISAEEERTLVRQLSEAPRFASQVLKLDEQIEKVARELSKAKDVLYLGRGTSYPLAWKGR
jgi:glucosamine--fructose-6-phosphate aminotransferase (isomerizing)